MTLIITWLIAGTFDCIAAIILFTSKTKQNPKLLFQYIASALGLKSASLGLILHYLIALIWTAT